MMANAVVGIRKAAKFEGGKGQGKEMGCRSGNLTSVSSYCVYCVGEEGSTRFTNSSQRQELLENLLSIPHWEAPFGLEVKLNYPGNKNDTTRHTTARG
jgi:hypothetical protein